MGAVAAIEERISAWLTAGVVDEPTAARIRAFEAGRGPRSDESARISVLEAMVYLGLAVGGVGVAVLTTMAWPDLAWPIRTAVFAAPAAVAFGAGQFFQRSGPAAFGRAGSVAWLACVPLLAAAAATVAAGAGAKGEDAALIAVVVGLVVAVALWRYSGGAAQVVGVAAAVIGALLAIAARPSVDSPLLAGFGISLAAIGGALIAELGLAGPRPAVRVCVAIAITAACFLVTMQEGIVEVWAPAVAIGLIVLAVAVNSLAYIVAGVATLFLSLIASVAIHVQDPAIVAVALIVFGLGLVVTVVLLIKARPWADRVGVRPARR